MRDSEIMDRCIKQLRMSATDAQWVVEHLYDYACPDFSEMPWEEIDDTFRSVLWFRGKTDAEIEALLCAS